VLASAAPPQPTSADRIVHLEAELARTQQTLAQVTAERDKLRRAYEQLLEQLELLRRRIFVAKAERIDSTQLEMEFAQTRAKLDALIKQLQEGTSPTGELDMPPSHALGADGATPPPARPRPKPTGRRDLAEEDLPEERVQITDPALEGHARRIGFESSSRLMYRRGGMIRFVVQRAKYAPHGQAQAVAGQPSVQATPDRPPGADTQPRPAAPAHPDVSGSAQTEAAPRGEPRSVTRIEGTAVESDGAADGPAPAFKVLTVRKPKELVERGILAASMIAHVLVSKYRWGLPFHRQARMYAEQGARIDDGTMCRYAEHVGATLGCIVDAMAKEAKERAFCLSTDATGVCIRPEPLATRARQACRKGHFFVVLADQDHVFFEFQARHTSAVACEMFRGFSGYIQADAHAIYDAVFRGEARSCDDDPPPQEVGCWSHCRRRVWEAAVVAKDPAAREALLRIGKLFDLEEPWAKLAPAQRHALRQRLLRPLVDDFFAWAAFQHARVKGVRGLVASAFGYAVRQETALRRFLEDGRLPMTNNHSERALRPIAAGRRVWLFFGSDDHASAAANLFSLIASCELHRLDPEAYLTDIIHVLPYWPRDRYLELAPKYWLATRARIPSKQLAVEICDITVPPALPTEKQSSPH